MRKTISAIAAVSAICVPVATRGQGLPPDIVASWRNVLGNRIEAAIILAGDQGIAGGTISQVSSSTDRRSVSAKVSKLGGGGDVGHPQPLDDLPLRWQPHLQGSMGYLRATNDFEAGVLQGDEVKDKSFAIQFGGGARFWFDDHFSVMPTIMGMYGHIDSHYTPRSAFAQANLAEAQQLGLVDWNADTWSIIPAAELQYVLTWLRTVFKLSSELSFYHTQTFRSSNPNLDVGGNSEVWKNMLDVDIPIEIELFDHELHTGGFFSRTDLYGDIRAGLDTEFVYQAHGRVVLYLLGSLWKVKWLGVGGSYLWGSNASAWTVAADVAFVF